MAAHFLVLSFKSANIPLRVMLYTWSPSIQEVEAGGPGAQGHPGLQSESLPQKTSRQKQYERETDYMKSGSSLGESWDNQ